MTAFVFDETGAFYERVDAETARYTVGEWQIENALVTRLEKQPKKEDSYRLPTTLSPGQVRQTFDNLDTTSFWELPALIDTARRAGLPVLAVRAALQHAPVEANCPVGNGA